MTISLLQKHTWYSTTAFGLADFPVYVWTLDRQAVGIKKISRRGYVSWRIKIEHGRTEDLPEWAYPALFRPIDPSKYPADLPEPSAILLPQGGPKPRVLEEPEPTDDYYFRPPYNLAPFIHPREAEVRFIRGLRTQSILEAPPAKGRALDWPREYIIAARVVEERLRAAKDDTNPDFYIDMSELEARPVRFSPTRLDLTDYLENNVVSWAKHVRKPEIRKVLELRAAVPSWSFAQIDDGLNLSKGTASAKYKAAIASIFTEANNLG
ncbi:MAG: hypothetical protein ACRCYS_04850 [Beijerinckiaceae bacterium]